MNLTTPGAHRFAATSLHVSSLFLNAALNLFGVDEQTDSTKFRRTEKTRMIEGGEFIKDPAGS